MRGLFSVLYLTMAVLACALLGGCAGSVPKNGPAALNIAQFTLAQGAANVPYKQLLVASGGVQPYTWSTSSGSLPLGLTLSSDGVISGMPSANASQYPTSGCMQTNSSFPITCNFAVQVVDSQLPTHAIDTMGLSIIINQDLSLPATSLSGATVGVAYTATIMAANGVPPYSYAVASGSLPDGLTLTTAMSMNGMANAATIAGTPTTAGVFSFTIQATDSATPSAERVTTSFTLTVVGILNGPYAMTFNGFDTSQPAGSQAVYLVGAFTPSGDTNGMGTISGVIDQTGSSPTPSAGTAVTGSYNIPLMSNFGTISFTRADNQESYKFDIALSGTNADSKMIEVDPNNKKWGSGLLKKQTATTIAAGVSYTFGSFGTDATGNRLAGAGAFALGPTLAVTGGAEDTNDNGTLSGEQFITAGMFTSPDPNTGRGTAMLIVGSNTNTYTYYVASSTELIAIETDSGGPATLVDILEQQSAGATGGLLLCKSGSMCQGALELDGIGTSGSPEVELGVASFSGCTGTPCAGNFMRSDTLPPYYVDQSVGGTFNPVSYSSGTYSIDASCGPMYPTPCGRVTLDLQGPTHQPVWYLTTTTQAFIVGGDADVLQGALQAQAPPAGPPPGFSLPNLLGSYLGGTITPVLSSITNEIDVAGTPPPGGTWSQNYETSGPVKEPTGLNLTGPYGFDPTYGAAFGRFAICAPMTTEYCTGSHQFMFNPDDPPIEIVYIVGGAQIGATGGKAGLAGMNLGLLQSNGTATKDPDPRLTTLGR